MSAAVEPAWLDYGRAQSHVREVRGPRHSPVILGWLRMLRAWWADDETPWCGAFVAACARAAGLAIPKDWYRARAWGSWGREIAPRVGALLVFGRGGGGHVGWYVGEDGGAFHVLGGNQSDRVSVARIAKGRLIACRWPLGVPSETASLHASGAGVPTSTDEA